MLRKGSLRSEGSKELHGMGPGPGLGPASLARTSILNFETRCSISAATHTRRSVPAFKLFGVQASLSVRSGPPPGPKRRHRRGVQTAKPEHSR